MSYQVAPTMTDLYKRYQRYYGPKRRSRVRKRKKKSFNQKVSNVINNKIETRYMETAISSTVPVDGTSVLTYLSGAAQGNDHDERSGDIAHIIGCKINGNIFATSQQILDSKCRIILLRCNKNITGVAPAITDFLVTDAVDSLEAIDNLHNRDFTYVWDAYFMLPAFRSPLADAKRARLNINYSKFWKPKKATWDADDAAVTASEKGAYFIVLMTDAASALQPRFEMNIRLYFKDN